MSLSYAVTTGLAATEANGNPIRLTNSSVHIRDGGVRATQFDFGQYWFGLCWRWQ
jgi:hypothetical protein